MDKRSKFNFTTVAVIFLLVLVFSSEVQAKYKFRTCMFKCSLACLVNLNLPMLSICLVSCLPQCGYERLQPPAATIEAHQPLAVDADTLNLFTDTSMAQTLEALDKCMNDECGIEECGGISNKACPPSSS